MSWYNLCSNAQNTPFAIFLSQRKETERFFFTAGCSYVKYHNLSADNTQLYTLYQILYSTTVLFCVKIGFSLTSKLSCVYS
jgi:hypothetical protein